jgi:hypothetical protein
MCHNGLIQVTFVTIPLHHVTHPIAEPDILIWMFHLHVLSRKVAINHNGSAIEPSVEQDEQIPGNIPKNVTD